MRKLALLLSFFAVTPLFLLAAIIFHLFILYNNSKSSLSNLLFRQAHGIAYAALPPRQNVFSHNLNERDIRVEKLETFFARYHSPLEPYAQNIVEAADFYGLNHALVPAIAMQESTLCKKIPTDSYNCWGFGIHNGRVKRFKGFAEAIDAVTRTLARDYKGKGLEAPEEIMRHYTPQNTNNWAQNVAFFMNQLN